MRDAIVWAAYCALVSSALALAAFAFEGAARATGRPTRWAWASALAGSIIFPLVSYLRPAHVQASNGFVYDVSAPTFTAAPPVATIPAGTSHTMLFVWIAISLSLLAYVANAYLALRRARRGWTRAQVQDVDVWLSDDVGPAALGVVTADIVLPRWVLSLNEGALRLMLLHEREHLRAWDPRLLLAGLVPIVLLPWNPAGWVMLRRLRRAIEFDCDARVLTHDPDPVRYGEVLLEVGRRRSNVTLALATFAEPRSHLEERIRRMAQWPGHQRLARATVLGAAAFMLTGAAFAVRGPVHARTIVDPNPAIANSLTHANTPTSHTISSLSVADTVRPTLQNVDEINRALNTNYPPLLRDAGIEGIATVSVLVGTDGKVERANIAHGSGYNALDAAALRVASGCLFTPGEYGGKRVAMWSSVVLQFGIEQQNVALLRSYKVVPDMKQADTVMVMHKRVSNNEPVVVDTVIHKAGTMLSGPGEFSKVRPKLAYVHEQPADSAVIVNGVPVRRLDSSYATRADPAPYVTPMTKKPQLVNRDEVQLALSRDYPALLRDAGIGGTTVVWVFIDENGKVANEAVNNPSGYDALDQAALKVAGVMQFTPAENMGKIVPVWLSVPIVFTIK